MHQGAGAVASGSGGLRKLVIVRCVCGVLCVC